jgi:hypothetical protein
MNESSYDLLINIYADWGQDYRPRSKNIEISLDKRCRYIVVGKKTGTGIGRGRSPDSFIENVSIYDKNTHDSLLEIDKDEMISSYFWEKCKFAKSTDIGWKQSLSTYVLIIDDNILQLGILKIK